MTMKYFIVYLLLLYVGSMRAQHTQTIRGQITDADTEMPLIGATIVLLENEESYGSTTDIDGNYRLEQVQIGRVSVAISYIGYEEKIIPNIVVNSGKEVILDVSLVESATRIDEVVVVAYKEKGNAKNEMVLVSGRSVSPEQTSRYAGGFNDPSRIVANFAGVATTQDGGNDIIVRGNSPKYVQWRLEGMQITNPNHFGDQSAVGGSVSTLNNNILDNSDFYTGAFTAEYGDVLSGVYDVKFRTGNNEKREAVFGVGLLGMDLTLEGPLKKNYGGSYLVNYRYSTAGLVNDLGLLGDIGGVPSFQDAAFKIVLPTKGAGVFSVYGLGGQSDFLWEDVKPETWVTPGNAFQRPEIIEDYQKAASLYNIGVNHTIPIAKNSYLKTGIIYSTESIDDEVFQFEYGLLDGKPDLDSLIASRVSFQNDLRKTTIRAASTYHHKFNAKHKIEIGTKFTQFGYVVNQEQLREEGEGSVTLLDFDEHLNTLRNFVNWKYRITEKLTMVTGLHNMNVLFNKKSTSESRFALSWQATKTATFNVGFGEHSTMESIHNYFTKVQDENGLLKEPNLDLDLLKARHYVLGFEKKLSSKIRTKLEAYYQQLYDLPVANDPTSSYATINEGLDFQYVELVNLGTGKNYGIEATVERYFEDNYYFLVNASLYESKYTALDGIERDARYNGNFVANFLCGKEFINLGKKNNQSLTINLKGYYGGGRRITPLLRDGQGQLAVQPDQNLFYDESNPYSKRLSDLYQVNLSASYKWNKKKSTHELFLNIDNVTDYKGQISEYYDVDAEGSVGYVTQFGIFPNLMYRVYF